MTLRGTLAMVVWAIGACLGTAAAAETSGAAEPGGARARSSFPAIAPGPWRIWTIRPDGSDLRQLTQAGADEQDVDPVFSPDGKLLLFTSTRGGKTGVWKSARDGSKPERICDGDQAEWSPGGQQIVLRRDEQIWTRELASGRENRISPPDWPHCSGPAWSPDGQRHRLRLPLGGRQRDLPGRGRRRQAATGLRQAGCLRAALVSRRQTPGL